MRPGKTLACLLLAVSGCRTVANVFDPATRPSPLTVCLVEPVRILPTDAIAVSTYFKQVYAAREGTNLDSCDLAVKLAAAGRSRLSWVLPEHYRRFEVSSGRNGKPLWTFTDRFPDEKDLVTVPLQRLYDRFRPGTRRETAVLELRAKP